RGQLDVDALDVVRVLAHAIQRDHHVFVDLEGVGVPCDRGGACAGEPEFLACFRRDGDEAFAVAGIGQAYYFAGGYGHRILVVADDVADQDHLGQYAALALGGVAHGAQVALVQVFEAGEQGTAFAPGAIQVVLNFDDGRDGITRLTEKFQTDRTGMRGHAMHDPARRCDQAVTDFLLHARQSRKELVGDVLAQAHFTEALAFDDQHFLAQGYGARCTAAVGPGEFKARFVDFMDLAQVVSHTGHFQPV